ncbi:hypothetical protein QAD02_003591 [Eretmocerus hayati]|uniref:Uncharacterized protein n=1 Tax=Eretmocerus hayati TaxID=131215 RepID=A0ACC2NMI4_9HYME|nr:hypothetical protein QAD02_003591 [Eretmocerus hayati]
MSHAAKKHHGDQCINPSDRKTHQGKNLRRIPKKMIESFPDLLETDKICAPCRKLFYEQNNTPSASSTSITETVSSNNNSIPHPHDEDLLSSLVEYLEAEDDRKFERRPHDDENSRVIPNKQDTVTVRVNEKKQEKQKRLLLEDITNLHSRFRVRFPENSIGLTEFAQLRPKWIVVDRSAGAFQRCPVIRLHYP